MEKMDSLAAHSIDSRDLITHRNWQLRSLVFISTSSTMLDFAKVINLKNTKK